MTANHQVTAVSSQYLAEAAGHVVPVGYKQTEIGVIPEDWTVTEIKDILTEISMGPFGSDIKVSNFVASGVPVLNGYNVSSEKLIDTFTNFVTHTKAKGLKKAVAARGDIVVTHRGTIGQISYIPEDSQYPKYVVSQSQFRVKFNGSVLPSWITTYFLSSKGAEQLLEGKGHTGVPAIAQPTTTFRKLKVPLPSIEEQTAIANALSDVDALINELEKLVAKKQTIKTATMQQLLTGRTRLSPFAMRENGTKKGYKQSELGEIPEDWEYSSLKEVSSFGGGTTPSRNQFERYYSSGIHPWVKTLDLNNGVITETEEYVTNDALAETSLKIHKAGSVLVAMYGGFNQIGRTGLLKIDAAINQALVAIIPDIQKLNSEYLLFNLNFHVNYWKGVASSSRKDPNITSNDVKVFVLPLPSVKEQTAIATILSNMDAEIQTLQQRLSKTRQVKQGMMQELLTGKIRLAKPAPKESPNV